MKTGMFLIFTMATFIFVAIFLQFNTSVDTTAIELAKIDAQTQIALAQQDAITTTSIWNGINSLSITLAFLSIALVSIIITAIIAIKVILPLSTQYFESRQQQVATQIQLHLIETLGYERWRVIQDYMHENQLNLRMRNNQYQLVDNENNYEIIQL